MAEGKREVEIKFVVRDARSVRRELEAAGAHYEGKYGEQNFFCDDPAGGLAAKNCLLRLRRSTRLDGPNAEVEERLTYKEPVPDPQFKVRNEYEVAVDDLDGLRAIFERLGFQCRPGYDKVRESWRLDGLLVTLDTLAFGTFLEVEGAPEQIGALAARLGFDLSEGITKSYLSLGAEAVGQGD